MAAARSLILLTHEFAPFRGGVATYVHELASAATRLGFDIEVWAPDRGAARMPVGYPVRYLRSSGRLTPGGLCSLGYGLIRHRRLIGNRPLILLSVGAHMVWAALCSTGNVSARQATIFFHGSETPRFERSFWKLLMFKLYRDAHALAANSEHVANLVASSPLTSGRTVSVARCAVPAELKQLAASPFAPIANQPLRILTVARLHPRKGQLELAEALGRLSQPVVYQMVGTGDENYRKKIVDTCRRLQISFELSGALDTAGLADAYRACDIYAQSSHTLRNSVEGFGISYLEAAAFGKPSVGIDVGGVGEAVIDGVTGLLAPPGMPEALTERIQRLIDHPELRARLGKAGRQHAATFSWEESARALCTLAA